ncbi:hypothetical protein FE773_02710 [Caminibacter mediatlanticus TB-2]|uniref:Chemotaxis protein CheZ n=2 Tax=Caminibacter mediatlanticus TaxID=291048 RepID=A0ABX5V773_9BACT|nr:hypothetical protein FE773_02710 [Caminibacter mediatlanticus TB-2]
MKLYIIKQKIKEAPMTQEELDALLESGTDIDNINEEDVDIEDENEEIDENLSEENEDAIMPPPADDDHKVVAQLDEVTKESELKASEVLEIISNMSEEFELLFNLLDEMVEFLNHQKEIFEKLHNKFPDIKTFKNELDLIEDKINKINEVLQKRDEISMRVMSVFEIMQYQDIHRQKIERVINIMRALIKYMNKLFEGKISDEERVGSAHYIPGDNKEVVSDEDIEEILKQLGV